VQFLVFLAALFFAASPCFAHQPHREEIELAGEHRRENLLPDKPDPVFPNLASQHSNPQKQQTPAAQQTPEAEKQAKARVPVPTHRFWDKQNIWLFSGVAAMRALDYHSTGNMRRRGRDEILLTNDIVDNKPAFAAIEAAGAATSVGVSYLFHRTNHHKLERWVSYLHIGVAGFGSVRNYCLKSAPTAQPAP
jgi:hypothetical protein